MRPPAARPANAGRDSRADEPAASFNTVADAETALRQLQAKQLVVELPRRPGQKESRWAHLLSGAPSAEVLDAGAGDDDSVVGDIPARRAEGRVEREDRFATLETTVAELREELARLRSEFDALRRQLE